MRVKVECL
uniref:Uncharacterized protein n=1 Tax=Arundo donax TaxID=35708 RepID=A0A0A9EKF9_ARUDO